MVVAQVADPGTGSVGFLFTVLRERGLIADYGVVGTEL